MDETKMKKLPDTIQISVMEIPVTLDIPNAVVIRKDLVKKGLIIIGTYVVVRKALRVYGRTCTKKERNRYR